MSDIGKQIADLMANNNKNAADITHGLSELGNGSMQGGLARIGTFFADAMSTEKAKGLQIGRLQGGIVTGGVIVAVAGVTHYIVNNKKKKKAEHEEEGRKIRQAFEKADSNKEASEEGSSY